ncbi:MAG: hypothetical protein AAF480_05645 [Actinomycetota bacterium]
MHRTIVQIARMRLADVRPGDVITGHPDDEFGWFVVHVVRQLPSGDLVASGESTSQSVKGSPVDLCGIQVTKQVDIPELADASEHTLAALN